MKKNILVTGANGQLGSEIREIAKNYENQFSFHFADRHVLDITDAESVDNFVGANTIQYIINCAAYTAVDKAEDDIEACYKVNRDATANLGKAANKYSAKMIHVSTDYVFDGTATEPYKETAIVNPQSVYGQSKLDGEVELQKVCKDCMIIRTAWVYSTFGGNFVKTMLRLGRERDALNVVADQKGTPTNAADLAKAILDILVFSEEKGFKSGIYHYSNEGEITWCDFTMAIHKLANIECKVSPITTADYPTRAKRPAYSVLSKEKIKEVFNLSVPNWEDSLKTCLEKMKA